MLGDKNLVKAGIEAYGNGLRYVLRDGKLDPEELAQLNAVAARYGLQDHHTRPLRAKAFESQSAARLADAVLTAHEVAELNDLIQLLGLTPADVPAAAAAIRRSLGQTTPPPAPAPAPNGLTPSGKTARTSRLEAISTDLHFNGRDWNKAWPLICEGLKLVPSRSAREVSEFYCRAGAALYAHRDVVEGALDKAIELFEAELKITESAHVQSVAWWKSYHAAEEARRKSLGFPPDTTTKPFIPEQSTYCLKQLCIIREKRGELGEAIRLCDLALTKAWPGDWLIRRAKLEKRLNRGKT